MLMCGGCALAPFVFDNPLPEGEAPTGTENPRGNSTGDLTLGLTMQSQWISFAVHLDPNFHGGQSYFPLFTFSSLLLRSD